MAAKKKVVKVLSKKITSTRLDDIVNGLPTLDEFFDEQADIRIQNFIKTLGGAPYKKDLLTSYLAKKAPTPEKTDEEIETGPTKKEMEDKELEGWTGFHSDENGIFIYEYVIKGFIKSALGSLMEAKKLPHIQSHKKWTDRLIRVRPRRIYFTDNNGSNLAKPDGTIDPNDPKHLTMPLERPLRAMTRQGERVTLVRSDFVEPGRELSFEIGLLRNTKKLTWEALALCFGVWGQHIGIGQWRGSGGYGRFNLLEMALKK